MWQKKQNLLFSRKFRDNLAAQFWYLFKCIYFGYSSIQVRLGYPKRIAGNFLMKRFNYINQIFYRVWVHRNATFETNLTNMVCHFSYLLIPFLLELRTIMDWMFTDTALGLSSWLQLEDVYSNVYLLKCARWAEKVKKQDFVWSINCMIPYSVEISNKTWCTSS